MASMTSRKEIWRVTENMPRVMVSNIRGSDALMNHSAIGGHGRRHWRQSTQQHTGWPQGPVGSNRRHSASGICQTLSRAQETRCSCFPMMTKKATKVITPLALSWGSNSDIISNWDSSMSQLEDYDGIIVAPATRNTISKHLNGIIDSPVMMALSALEKPRH